MLHNAALGRRKTRSLRSSPAHNQARRFGFALVTGERKGCGAHLQMGQKQIAPHSVLRVFLKSDGGMRRLNRVRDGHLLLRSAGRIAWSSPCW
jgi:hypothetical protein